MHLQENTLFDLDHTKHRPVYHVIYASTKFAVPMSNSLGDDAFTRKYII